jgi:hypothetical protein
MIVNILLYFLVGVIFGFTVETINKSKGDILTSQERTSIIVFWPAMVLVFLFHFIEAFLK